MIGNIRELSKYSLDDDEKMDLIRAQLDPPLVLRSPFKHMKHHRDFDELNDKLKFNLNGVMAEAEFSELFLEDVLGKVCPSCGRKYPSSEVVCFDCLVHLKDITDRVDVSAIDFKPQFGFEGENTYDSLEDLLCEDNLSKIRGFDFTYKDYGQVLHDIMLQALKNFDSLIRDNELDFDDLDILEKITVFAKSFVKVDYKSSGEQLGYFENNSITVDDRQTKSLQITTLIHELAHFLIQEILSRVLCRLIDASKNGIVESLTAYILSYSAFTQLIDEYSAHNVEGRFAIFGYQDYSSYMQIEAGLDGEMTRDEIEITKSIGNNFSISIKEILESVIDKDLRQDIKSQFLDDTRDRPDYAGLKMENCHILNDEGFMKAIWLILNDGCEIAVENIDDIILNK